MLPEIEKKKKRYEIKKLEATVMDQEIKIEEKMLEIGRLEDHIRTLHDRIEAIAAELRLEE